MTDKCLPTLVVGDEDKFHRLFRGGEDGCGLVGLFVCGNKPHMPRRDLDEGRHDVVVANLRQGSTVFSHRQGGSRPLGKGCLVSLKKRERGGLL